MRILTVKVVTCFLYFNGFFVDCNAQRDSLRNIFPDNGLINTIDQFADSLIVKNNNSFLSFVSIARYGRYGLLLWSDNQKYKSLWFFYRKDRLRIRPIPRKYKNRINIKMLLESNCDYKKVSGYGRGGISQDYVMRIKTKTQEVYYWYSNYLACKDSCVVRDLNYLMGWGF